jgi:signal transduction histidine kinase
MKYLYFGFVLLLSFTSYSQNYSIQGADSLKQLVKKSKLDQQKAQMYIDIAEIYLENDLDSAAVYRRKATLLFEKNRDWRDTNLQLLKIREYITLKKFEKAKAAIEFLKLNKLSTWKNHDHVLTFYFLESLYYHKSGNYKESIKITTNTIQKNENLESNIIGNMYLTNANASMQLFDLKESIISISKASQIFQKNKNKIGLNKCYITLSYHYMYTNDFNNAFISIKKAQNINDNIKSVATKIIELTALGTVYFYNKDYANAKKNLQQVIVLNKSLKLTQVNSVANRYINLSNYELGNYRELIADCKEQIKDNTIDYEKYSTYYQMVSAYNMLQEYDHAKIYLNKMEAINASNKNLVSRDVLEYLMLSMVTEKGLGNVDKAYNLSQDYNNMSKILNDSLSREETIKNQVLFETKEKELKVKDLTIAAQKDKELLIKKENQKTFLIALLVFGLFLGIITFVFYKKIQKRNSKLELQNSIIEQQNKEISKSNATIKKTFSIISHDLRGPFNVLLGYTNYINDNFDECSKEELKSYIIKVNNAAQNNFNFTQQLLNWSLKQQNGITINKELCNLNEVVEKSIATLQPLAHQKDIAIHKDFLLEDDAKHYLDKDIIFNVLYNVISNSIKYSKDNTSIQIRTYADEKSLTIETKDNGKGMTIEQLQKLNQNSDVNDFNFIKNNNEYQGGFGLTYARELANLYGAQLVFESVLGEGTSVNFKIELQS